MGSYKKMLVTQCYTCNKLLLLSIKTRFFDIKTFRMVNIAILDSLVRANFLFHKSSLQWDCSCGGIPLKTDKLPLNKMKGYQ